MSEKPLFLNAHPYQNDVLALPVTDLNTASNWYCKHFEMEEVGRVAEPVPTVILERDGVKIGFAINGGDPSQDGAAIEVNLLDAIFQEMKTKGVNVSETRVDHRDDGSSYRVFFVVAPDGLCFYFHQLLEKIS